MTDFNPFFTADGSVGLYNNEFNDIYHSVTGALTEAYDKFIYPVDFDFLLTKCNDLRVLDICYGIGYNTKSLLNFLYKNFLKNKNKINSPNRYIPIKSSKKNDKFYSDKIDAYNKFNKISVTAIDNDKDLCLLSPFIKTGEEKYIEINKKLNINNSKINHYLENTKYDKLLKIENVINYLIYYKIANNNQDFFNNNYLNKILKDKKYQSFFESDIRGIYALESAIYDDCMLKCISNLNLHNIYYQYLSNRYKNNLKSYLLSDINFKFICDDARNFIKNDTNTYNLIFLDAFTPSKCPCLWTYDFFKELYSHLDYNGYLLTYSKSASVRNAMLQSGFLVGNIYNHRLKKVTGTIGTKNNNLIKYPLSEFDFGLLKTKAGIFYRDENLSALNGAIINRREIEVNNSDLISSSKYIKMHIIL